jgi:hypothetical protein
MARQLAPMHPGEVLREEFLLPLGLSAGALAKACGVPRPASKGSPTKKPQSRPIPHYGLARRFAPRPSFG